MASCEVTEDDLNSMYYFHFEKGDITRWISWEERKPVIENQFPELIQAYNLMKTSESLFSLTLKDALNKFGE